MAEWAGVRRVCLPEFLAVLLAAVEVVCGVAAGIPAGRGEEKLG